MITSATSASTLITKKKKLTKFSHVNFRKSHEILDQCNKSIKMSKFKIQSKARNIRYYNR